MLTPRGIGLAGAAGGLWLASRVFGIPELQMAAVACLALLALAVVVTRVASASMTVDRDARPARLHQDEQARVTLVVHNRSRLPTAFLQLEDAAPAALASRGARMLVGSLPPMATRTMTYRLHAHRRGRFEVGPLSARMRDPFGLVSRRVVLPGTTRLVVYPRVWPLPEGVPLGGPTASGVGNTRPLAGGDDLAHVREYVRGDDLRKVHWPTTAHRGKLMIRQPEAPRDPRATVVLDVRAQAHRGYGRDSSLETAVSAAASVARHLADRGRSVTLVDRPLAAPPRPRSWDEHLADLAEARAERIDLVATLRGLARAGAGDGLVVAIVAVPDHGELRELVRAGRGFGNRLALLIDTHSHVGGGRAPEAIAVTDALRASGWRASLVSAGDRLDDRWGELALRPRRAPAGAGR